MELPQTILTKHYNMSKDLPEIKPQYPAGLQTPNIEQPVLGQQIVNAPQSVTAPPATPSWATSGSGTGSPWLSGSNTTELTAIDTTLNDIYNALLKEGLIKKK